MSKKINMSFLTAGGRKSTISLDDPKDNLIAETVTTAMNDLIADDVFEGPDGEPYASPEEAKIVETTETVLF